MSVEFIIQGHFIWLKYSSIAKTHNLPVLYLERGRSQERKCIHQSLHRHIRLTSVMQCTSADQNRIRMAILNALMFKISL